MTLATSPRPDWSLRDWFAAPDLPTRELRRQARALWIVSWPFLAVLTGMLGILTLVQPETLPRRVVTISVVAALVIAVHALSRRGKPGLASWLLVISFSVFVTQRAWITGGIHTQVAVFYLLFTVMAGTLLGFRGAIVTAIVCALGAAALTAGELFELLVPRAGAGPPLAAFMFVMLAIGLALALQALISASVAGRVGPDLRSSARVRLITTDARPGRPARNSVPGPERWKREVRRGRDRRREELSRTGGNLLEVSRLEAGHVTVGRVLIDVGTVAHEVVEAFRIQQAKRDLTVVVRGEPVCQCDPDLTRRVLENLVGNAIKHTPTSGRVVVVVSALPDRVRIAVSDEGSGLPAMVRARIFEPYFAKSIRTSKSFELSGLGLAFCRLAVEAQGGTIRVEDLLPQGSIFIVDLPR